MNSKEVVVSIFSTVFKIVLAINIFNAFVLSKDSGYSTFIMLFGTIFSIMLFIQIIRYFPLIKMEK